MYKIRKDVLIMNNNNFYPDEFNMISVGVRQLNGAFMRLHDTAKESAEKLEKFKNLTETELHGGNKRNGTQDRRQAFGGLF